ncbi:hypothetical protein [Nitrosomonas sp.]|uniref:hypothetical protein n=1 Tax=Nitrosomonas sp. TaxID=42353 RepID=UPI0025D8C9BE|nr:hypothetical protein [Nitrosomonas sp.]
MRCIRELIDLVNRKYPDDRFFADIDQKLELPLIADQYQAYERALSGLDSESWVILKDKAIAHFMDHREGQMKQGFFNQLNDAFAYRYLVKKGYEQVRILREDGKIQPDIKYFDGSEEHFCEIKTIGISNEVIERRANFQVTSSLINQELSPGFLNKLRTTLDIAERQIMARSSKGLIYLLVHFDDFTLDYYDRYRKQIVTCLEMHSAEDVYVKIGLIGRKHIKKLRLEARRLG